MHIKEILQQNRRDFKAIYQCEHCGFEVEGRGYDDLNFHENVIPAFTCSNCSRKADENYQPLSPKYPEDFQI